MWKRIKRAFVGLVLVVLTSSLGACCWGGIGGVPGGGGPGGPGPSGIR